MSSRTDDYDRRLGVEVVDRSRVLEILNLALAVSIPTLGPPFSMHLLRQARETGRDTYLAKLGLQISIFLLSLYVLIMLVGLFFSVVIPALNS